MSLALIALSYGLILFLLLLKACLGSRQSCCSFSCLHAQATRHLLQFQSDDAVSTGALGMAYISEPV